MYEKDRSNRLREALFGSVENHVQLSPDAMRTQNVADLYPITIGRCGGFIHEFTPAQVSQRTPANPTIGLVNDFKGRSHVLAFTGRNQDGADSVGCASFSTNHFTAVCCGNMKFIGLVFFTNRVNANRFGVVYQ
jgi:hypothetical protein